MVVVGWLRKYTNLCKRYMMSVNNNHWIIRHSNTIENDQCCQNIQKWEHLFTISTSQISLYWGALCLQLHVSKESLQLQKGQNLQSGINSALEEKVNEGVPGWLSC